VRRVPVGEGERLQVAVAPARHHLAAVAHGDVGCGRDPLDQVLDIVSASVAARTTSTTRLAKRDRLSAAWPAELAAPTT
jgi:hypothetical protein